MVRLSDIIRKIFGRLEGAAPSPTRRSFLPQRLASARLDATIAERREIVRKARWLEYNNHLLNRLADIFECYTVGSGVPINPSSIDAEWNAKAKKTFEIFAKFPCVNSRMSFSQFQSLVARRWFVDGECFILLTRGDSGRPRLQLIETHLVATPESLKSEEGRTIIDGIRIDPSNGGRPVGYYIGDDSTGQLIVPEVAISSEFVIHVSEPMRAGQYRSLPFVTPVINLLHDLDDLHLYEMQCAKDAATFGPFIKTASGEVDPRTLRLERVKKTVSASSGASATVDKAEYYEDIGAGKIRVLQSGDDIVIPSSQRPSVVTQQYWRMVTEQICNGIGIPYVLAFPESLQGTTYRGTLAMAAAMFRARATVLAEAWARIWEWVMRYEIATNAALRPPPADWWNVTMQPPRAPDVDVGYNSAATIAELQAGLTNYDLVYSARGLDWREEFRKLREQIEFAESLGLNLSSQIKINQ